MEVVEVAVVVVVEGVVLAMGEVVAMMVNPQNRLVKHHQQLQRLRVQPQVLTHNKWEK